MCLLDREGRVVASTDAALELFGVSREEVVGTVTGHQIMDEDQRLAEKLWQQLVSTNKLHTETLVTHPDGRLRRVRYAGHGTMIDGRWHALMVMLSVRVEPDGDDPTGMVKDRLCTRSAADGARDAASAAGGGGPQRADDRSRVGHQFGHAEDPLRAHLRQAGRRRSRPCRGQGTAPRAD